MSQEATGAMGADIPSSSGAASGLTPGMLTAIAALPLALLLLKRVVFPTVSAREPPVLRPKIPFFGHVISLMREKTAMYERLYQETPMPICSLPMLNGWIYLINDPGLIAAAMRNRDLSFDPFTIEFAGSAMGMTPQQVDVYSRTENLEAMTQVIHSSLTGDNVLRMNVRALADIADVINGVGPGAGLNVPDLFEWLRTVVAKASSNALWGKNSALGPEDADDLWNFEKGIGLLALGVAPSLIAPDALAARKRGQAKLKQYYADRLDEGPDVSALIKNRAALHRRLGLPDDTLSIPEYAIAFAATSNTIGVLAWFFLNVFESPELVERIRDEVEVATAVESSDAGRRTATVDISRLDKECPTLFACYRETLRLYADTVGNRRAMQDTTLRDPSTGREYLLRKGTTVQWPARLPHALESVWGPDARSFRPDRWLEATSAEERKRRVAMIPFGGGKTLCPGRYFAQAENLGLVAAVALGFEVEGAGAPKGGVAYMGTAMKRPEDDWSPGVRLRRREGWENVTWEFKC